MFRLVKAKKLTDPTFPVDYKELGVFLNEEDEFRQIESPELPWKYKFSKSNRINEVRAEALNVCIRKTIFERLSALGLTTIRLPLTDPPIEPTNRHIPILSSVPLDSATPPNRLVIIFNATNCDLGILSPRFTTAPAHGGLNAGSAVNLVKYIQFPHASTTTRSTTRAPPAILLANAGQLLWHRKTKQAISKHQWESMPRRAPECHSAPVSERNFVERNSTPDEHIRYVLFSVVPRILAGGGKVQIIAVDDICRDLVHVLQDKWAELKAVLDCVAWVCPGNLDVSADNEELEGFLRKRCRVFDMGHDESIPRDPEFTPPPHSSAKETGAQDRTAQQPLFDPTLQPRHDDTASSSFGVPYYMCPDPTKKGIVDKAKGQEVRLDFPECGLCSWGGRVVDFLGEAWDMGEKLVQPEVKELVPSTTRYVDGVAVESDEELEERKSEELGRILEEEEGSALMPLHDESVC